ncbi:MAG: phosphatidate cytidylyltransferase [Chloroflexota bacterium]
MFLKRAIVTLTIGPLLLYLVTVGGWFYFVPFLIVLSVAVYEYTQILGEMGWRVPFFLLLPLLIVQWFNAQFSFVESDGLIWAASFLIIMIYGLWLYEAERHEQTLMSWFSLIVGVIVLGWLGSHFFWIRRLEEMAWQWTMLTFLATMFADIGAYLVGRFLAGRFIFGKHQLTPYLSPNKTVEGFAGGLLFATAVAVLIAPILGIPVFYGVLLGILVSIVGPMGDLSISLLKREAGVKDSGILFPGHGGALDRIDSLIWSTTVGYYLAVLLF